MLVFSVLSINFRIPNPSVHDALLIAPPAPPAPAKIPHIELPHTMMWSPMGQSFTTTTQFDGFSVAQQGNDAGIFVLHLSIPMNNALLPLTICTSSCKNLFGAGTVLLEKKPAAGFFPLLAPILTCCFPIPVPWFMLPVPNTVWIGMTFADFMAGWARVAVEVAVAAIFAKLGGNKYFSKIGEAGEAVGARLAARLGGKAIAQAIAKEYGKALAEDLFKGLTVSMITQGKVEAPYQIAEYNPWTGEGKVFTHEGRGPALTGTNYSVGAGIDAAQTSADAPDPAAGAADGLPAAD